MSHPKAPKAKLSLGIIDAPLLRHGFLPQIIDNLSRPCNETGA
jgi:hypothetical protein